MLSRVTNFCVIFPIFPEYFDQGYKNISASGPLAGTRYIRSTDSFNHLIIYLATNNNILTDTLLTEHITRLDVKVTLFCEQQTQTTKCEYIWMFIKLHYRGPCNIKLDTNIHILNIDANTRKAWREREIDRERESSCAREREGSFTGRRLEWNGIIYTSAN